ncbi:MAG: NAD(+)/NADH kinase [Thermotogota bacterium]
MKLERIYLVVNPAKPAAQAAVERLETWCRKRGVQAVPIAAPSDVSRSEGAIAVALGGDGTILRAAARVADAGIPILGVNVGSLGFLSQAPLDRLVEAVERVAGGDFTVEERMRLRYEVGATSGTALNEIVVTGASPSRFCEIELEWEGSAVASYPGDGLIVATATGSTAYSLSAGGPIIVPPAACLLVTPLATHRLGLRPVLFPSGDTLRIRALERVQLVADGDLVGHVGVGAEVVVRKAAQPTLLVRLSGAPSFFCVLDEKLNWPDSLGRCRES